MKRTKLPTCTQAERALLDGLAAGSAPMALLRQATIDSVPPNIIEEAVALHRALLNASENWERAKQAISELELPFRMVGHDVVLEHVVERAMREEVPNAAR